MELRTDARENIRHGGLRCFAQLRGIRGEAIELHDNGNWGARCRRREGGDDEVTSPYFVGEPESVGNCVEPKEPPS